MYFFPATQAFLVHFFSRSFLMSKNLLALLNQSFYRISGGSIWTDEYTKPYLDKLPRSEVEMLARCEDALVKGRVQEPMWEPMSFIQQVLKFGSSKYIICYELSGPVNIMFELGKFTMLVVCVEHSLSAHSCKERAEKNTTQQTRG